MRHPAYPPQGGEGEGYMKKEKEIILKKDNIINRVVEDKKPLVGNDLSKQVANLSFIVRRMKTLLENVFGLDIDGDGRIGRGPTKLMLLALAFGLLAGGVYADAKTNIANWGGTEADPWTYIDDHGNLSTRNLAVKDSFTVNTNVTISATMQAADVVATDDVNVGDDLIVTGKVTVGETLEVTGIATFTADPVLSGLTASKAIFTSAGKAMSSTGTLGVDQGGTGDGGSWTSNGVFLGKADSAFGVTAAGTDGQVLVGQSDAEPEWKDISSDATIDKNGAVTVSKGLAMTNGASLQNIPTTAVAGEALVKTSVMTGDVNGVWNALAITEGAVVNADINAAAAIDPSKIAGTAVTQGQVYASADITIGAMASGQLITTNTIQALDVAGNNYEENTLMRFWTASAANALTVADGVIVQTVTDKQNYWIAATNAGSAIVVITEATCITNTLSVSVGPRISSESIPLVP